MVGGACLPSNAYYLRTPDYTLYSGVHVCWSEHSESSFVYGFMSLWIWYIDRNYFVFISTPSYEASPLCSILCICSNDSVGMLKSLREALRVSSDHHGSFFFLTCSSPQRNFFGKRLSDILVTWPVHLNCANFRRVCIHCIPAPFRTFVSGKLSCHLIFRTFPRQLRSGSVFWHAVGKLSKSCMRIIVLAAPPLCILSALCQV